MHRILLSILLTTSIFVGLAKGYSTPTIFTNALDNKSILPFEGDTINTTNVLFQWQQEPESEIYHLQIALIDSAFLSNPFESNLIVDIFDSTIVTIINEGLNWGKGYIWRVGTYYSIIDTTIWNIESTFYIPLLPSEIPELFVTTHNLESYSPGITLFNISTTGIALAVNRQGQIVWFINVESDVGIFLRPTYFLPNGNMLALVYTSPGGKAYEITLDNEIIWSSPNIEPNVHHDVFPMPNGNYLALTYKEQNGPIPEGSWSDNWTGIDSIRWRGDVIKEWDKNGEEVWSWSVFDNFDMVDYDSIAFSTIIMEPYHDWTHSNSIFYDPEDQSIYLSTRHLSRITKIDYLTGNIIWMLGKSFPSNDIIVGNDLGFSWQHAVKVLDNNNLLFFDNGNLNSPQISRAIEVAVNETDLLPSTEIVWEYILPEDKFARVTGDADRLENGNTLITAGGIGYILEVGYDSTMIWELQMGQVTGAGTFMYRAERILGLYPQAFSVLLSNYIIENNYNVVQLDMGLNEIGLTIYNEGWLNETYNYSLSDSIGIFNYSGYQYIPSNSSIQLSFIGTENQQVHFNPAQFIVTPSQAQSLSDTIDFIISNGCDNSVLCGCMNTEACNYDPNVTVDDNSCTYAEENYDCNGNQLSLFNGLIPEDFSIHSIYPNPFNPVTNIIYGLPEYSKVHIIIYNISGQPVITLVNEYQTPGYYSTAWNADGYPSGIYFVNIIAGEYVNTQKLMLVK